MKPPLLNTAKTHSIEVNSQNQLLHSLKELIKTREMREALSVLIPEVLKLWAGENILKKTALKPIGKSFQKGLEPESPSDSTTETPINDIIPEVISSLINALKSSAQRLETLPPEEKEKRLQELATQLSNGQTGKILTSVMKSIHDLHGKNPTVLAELITPAVRKWMESTDFGALRDTADSLGPEIQALAEGINAILWEYPSKLVLSLSFVPDLINALVMLLKESVRKFNEASPDLVADIFFSLIRSIDGKSLGDTLSELTELIRKIHTGSALIGDPGISIFQHDMRQMINDVVDQMDSRNYWAARTALESDKETLKRAFLDAASKNPNSVIEGIKTFSARNNPGFMTRRCNLEAFDDIPDDDMSTAIEEGMSDLDLQELCEIVNLGSVLANRMMALRPALIRDYSGQIAASLDLSEIKTALQEILKQSEETLRPVLRSALPDLLLAFCRILEPEDDEYEENMAKARKQLKSILIREETAQ